jgi:CxxC motif-containing protein (DUF1111 family)
MVMAIHLPGGAPEPLYGRQIQTLGVQGIRAEGLVRLSYRDRPVRFADGMIVTLQNPRWSLSALANGSIDPQTIISPRIAPPMIGVGLLEAIADDDIRANADPDDRDRDGISGRVSMVTDTETGREAIGRMGWKAGQATVPAQAATAFFNDMGLSTPLFTSPYGDCAPTKLDCRNAPNGGDGGSTVEVDPRLFDLVVFYSRNLAVPARRHVSDPQVLAGKKLFYDSGCIACHRPKYVTRRLSDRPEQSFQLIWPYTDMLLHDMGEALADRRIDRSIADAEWRTPPLWGIGLTREVSGHTRFLHDGRARHLLEAVLWHGGEAEAAKRRVLAMSKAERDALIAFLNSL